MKVRIEKSRIRSFLEIRIGKKLSHTHPDVLETLIVYEACSAVIWTFVFTHRIHAWNMPGSNIMHSLFIFFLDFIFYAMKVVRSLSKQRREANLTFMKWIDEETVNASSIEEEATQGRKRQVEESKIHQLIAPRPRAQ